MNLVNRSRRRSVVLLTLLGALAVEACGGDDSTPLSAVSDGGNDLDASTGANDGSLTDAADAGPNDATVSDAAPADAAATDAGDASANDSGADAGWPSDLLPAADAEEVDPSELLSVDQLRAWQVDLDARGLRATGTDAHESFIDALYDRLTLAGLQQIHYEPVTLSRWSVDSWSLAIATGPSAGTLQTAAYVPYSGTTPASGVTAPLVFLADGAAPTAALAGKIVLFDEPQATVPTAYFSSLAEYTYDPNHVLVPSAPYSRAYLYRPTALLDALQAAGAVGAIGIIAAPYDTAKGTYSPFDGKLRAVPSVFVAQDVGAQLKSVADGTTQATLTLPATVTQVQTRNLVGVIPGASDEITVINSHTDGTNGIEDNGPGAIVAMTQYLSRLPQASLPRTVMVLLTSGHFAGGLGALSFLSAHASDGLLDEIASIVTVEHMGAEEWLPDTNGLLAPTGNPELSGFFMPSIQALEDASYAMAQQSDCSPALIMTPTNPSGTGTADNQVWPGEGQYFWGVGRIPTVNYITGPTYLLNYGVTTVDKVDFDRMRRETVGFTQMLLNLSRRSAADLALVKN